MPNEVHINHAFVSAKPESPDSTIVSKNEWNADEVISGGSDGMFLMRDASSPTGARFSEPNRVMQSAASFSGPTAAQTPIMGTLVVTVATPCYVLLLPHVLVTLTAGNGSVLNVRKNAAVVHSPNVNSNGLYTVPSTFLEVLAPGTYTYDAYVVGVSGNVVTAAFALTLLILGKL